MSNLVIHPRSSWTDSHPGGDTQIVNPGEYTLYVHYSENVAPKTQAEARDLLRSIRAFHMGPDRGWADFAYSYACCVIGGKLHVWGGRGKGKVPSAQQGANAGNLAIVFLGNAQTPVPDVAVKGLAEFAKRYGAGRLAPHSHQNNTDCPGDKLRAAVPKAAKLAGIPSLK